MFGWFVEEAEFVRRSQEDTEIALQEFQTQDTAVGLDEHAPFMDDIRPTRGQENEVKGKGTRFQQGSSREGQQVQHMSFADFTHSADMVNNVALTVRKSLDAYRVYYACSLICFGRILGWKPRAP